MSKDIIQAYIHTRVSAQRATCRRSGDGGKLERVIDTTAGAGAGSRGKIYTPATLKGLEWLRYPMWHLEKRRGSPQEHGSGEECAARCAHLHRGRDNALVRMRPQRLRVSLTERGGSDAATSMVRDTEDNDNETVLGMSGHSRANNASCVCWKRQ